MSTIKFVLDDEFNQRTVKFKTTLGGDSIDHYYEAFEAFLLAVGVTINPEMAFEAGAASRDAEIAELNRKIDFWRARSKEQDTEIAELVEALEDNWNCNPCETTRQQVAFDRAQSTLAKVRKP